MHQPSDIRNLSVRRAGSADVVELPMSASDIADYLRLTPEAMRRGFRELERRSVIKPEPPHRIHILDRDGFNLMLPDMRRVLRT